MPELPEVETVRRGVATHAVGRRIASVQVLHPRATRRQAGGAAEFAERGLTASVADIARRAGVAKATVFRHFASKEDLIVAIVTGHLRTLTAAAADRADDPEALFLEPRHRAGAAAAEFGDFEAEFAAVFETGVDGVFADHPDLALAVRDGAAG